MRVPRRSFPLLLLLSGVVASLPAQEPAPKAIVLGDRITLTSSVLGESRQADVFVPTQASGSTARFPVIYTLDGEVSFVHTVSAASMLSGQEEMPQAIVVAVRNVDRERDFIPSATNPANVPSDLPTAGGADRFLAFLEQELIPYVDAHYPTQPYRVLIGHSFGGLFALHALTERPALFQGYVALEPSLWWDAGTPTTRLLTRLSRPETGLVRLVVAEGVGRERMGPRWAEVARAIGATGVAQYIEITGENHVGMTFPGRYQSLRALFAEYVPRYRREKTLPDRAALVAQYQELSRRWGYQVAPPAGATAEVLQREMSPRAP